MQQDFMEIEVGPTLGDIMEGGRLIPWGSKHFLNL